MKFKQLLTTVMAGCCFLFMQGCEEADEPEASLELLQGKWKVVTHEGYPTVPRGQGVPIGFLYLNPYRFEGGDSLYWQFSADGGMKLKDPYLVIFELRNWAGFDSLAVSKDTTTYLNWG